MIKGVKEVSKRIQLQQVQRLKPITSNHWILNQMSKGFFCSTFPFMVSSTLKNILQLSLDNNTLNFIQTETTKIYKPTH